MSNANETISDIMQIGFYEGEAEFPADFASQGPCKREFGAVDTGVFESTRCGDGGDGVNATVEEACPICEGNGRHFSERGYVVVQVAL
jgi:hypothetical protein